MPRTAGLLVLALFLAGCGGSGAVEAKLDPPGRKAPDFTLVDLAGDDLTLSALRGSVVVLNFWDTG